MMFGRNRCIKKDMHTRLQDSLHVAGRDQWIPITLWNWTETDVVEDISYLLQDELRDE